MSDEIKIIAGLDLDDSKAHAKLNDFKKLAQDNDIKIKLDFDNVNGQLNKIKSSFNNAFKLDSNNDLVTVERKLKEINSLMNKQSNKSNSMSGMDASVKEYLNVVKKLENLYSDLHKAEGSNNDKVVKALNEEINLYRKKQLEITSNLRANNTLSESMKKLIKQEEDLARARSNTKNSKTDTSDLNRQQSELNKLNSEYDKYSRKLSEIGNKIKGMSNTKGFLDENLLRRTNELLEKTKSSLNAQGLESNFEQVSNSVRELQNNLQALNSGNTLARQEQSFNTSFDQMRNRVEQFIHTYRDLRNIDDIGNGLRNSLNEIDTSNIERATTDLRQFGVQLNRVQNEARNVERSGGMLRNFGRDFKENLFTFTAGELLADGIRNVGYSIKTLVMDYDRAFTDLKKVADPAEIASIDQLDKIGDRAVNIAKNVGQSSVDVIKTVSDITQSTGRNMEQSFKIAEQTMKLANVADISQEIATKGVSTMVSAFNLDPMKDIPIVVNGVTKSTNELTNAFDVLNHLGNNFAISSAGILEALQSGGSVLSSYGVTLNDTAAMITAANTTLQKKYN